jgi:hypothetical protein
VYPQPKVTEFYFMFYSPAFGVHFCSPPGDILGSEQIAETLESKGTTTQFWRRSADR